KRLAGGSCDDHRNARAREMVAPRKGCQTRRYVPGTWVTKLPRTWLTLFACLRPFVLPPLRRVMAGTSLPFAAIASHRLTASQGALHCGRPCRDHWCRTLEAACRVQIPS